MGELKSCLFCGKNVEIPSSTVRTAATSSDRVTSFPVLIEETTGESIPAVEEDYLVRLRTLQELLSDMERELDLIIKTSSKDP